MIISRSESLPADLAGAPESCTVEELMDQEDLAATSSDTQVGPKASSPTGFLAWMQPSSFAWMLDTCVYVNS